MYGILPRQLFFVSAQLAQCWFRGITISSKKVEVSHTRLPERRVPELIPVLGSQLAGDVSHKPGGRLPLLSAWPGVTPATLKRAATNFGAWWTEAQWVWAVCLRLLPDSVATAIWTRESSTLTTQLPSHPRPFPVLKYKHIFQIKLNTQKQFYQTALRNCYGLKLPQCRLH